MELKDALKEIRTKPTVPLWPHVGLALNLSRGSVYAAARRNEIDVIKKSAAPFGPSLHRFAGNWDLTPLKAARPSPRLKERPLHSFSTHRYGAIIMTAAAYNVWRAKARSVPIETEIERRGV